MLPAQANKEQIGFYVLISRQDGYSKLHACIVYLYNIMPADDLVPCIAKSPAHMTLGKYL